MTVGVVWCCPGHGVRVEGYGANVLDTLKSWETPITILKVDLQKAFDTVTILQALNQTPMNPLLTLHHFPPNLGLHPTPRHSTAKRQ